MRTLKRLILSSTVIAILFIGWLYLHVHSSITLPATPYKFSIRPGSNLTQVSQQLADAGFEVDYIENHERWRLGAVRLEGIRLIDNVRRDERMLHANGGTTSVSSAARTKPD